MESIGILSFRFALYDDGSMRNPLISCHQLRLWYRAVSRLFVYSSTIMRLSGILSSFSPTKMMESLGILSFRFTLYDDGPMWDPFISCHPLQLWYRAVSRLFVSPSTMIRPCGILSFFSPTSLMCPHGVLSFRMHCVQCLYHEGFGVFLSQSTIIVLAVLL